MSFDLSDYEVGDEFEDGAVVLGRIISAILAEGGSFAYEGGSVVITALPKKAAKVRTTAKVEPVIAEPAKVEPVVQTVKSESVAPEPVKVEPVAEPVVAAPVKVVPPKTTVNRPRKI